jgi:hypothetical protein
MAVIKKFFKGIIRNIIYDWGYLGVLNSPFVGLKVKWYFGEIKHGIPYFLPRKLVKCNLSDAIDAWDKLSEDMQKAYLITQTKEEWLKRYAKGHQKFVTTKYFGWNSTTLGWKTKWRYNDYRFEWSPCYSLVIFGKQLFACVLPKMEKIDKFGIRQDSYWEAYLTYRHETDRTKSKEERLKETVKLYSCTWGSESTGFTDYYPQILKKKYHKYYQEIKNELKQNN